MAGGVGQCVAGVVGGTAPGPGPMVLWHGADRAVRHAHRGRVLGLVLGCAWQTVRQRLREWYWDADDKPGLNRREVDVRRCFAPLARWVLAHWSGTRVALAMDATSLGDRLTILTISIVYKGCAVPIAWKILPGNQKHAWNPEWLALLALLKPGYPTTGR